MVLAELGSKLSAALNSVSLKGSNVTSEEVESFLTDIGQALLSADVAVEIVESVKADIRKSVVPLLDRAGLDKMRVIKSSVEDALVRLVDPGCAAFDIPKKKGKTWVVMAVGLQGAGKTTTLMKIAAYYVQRRYSVGVVCADTFRAGAHEQLRQNCIKAKAEFYGSETEMDPVAIAAAGVKKFKQAKADLILVDTAGRHQQDAQLFHEMSVLSDAVSPDHIVMILDGTAGAATATTQATAFASRVDIGWFVITKLDGAARGGGALSAVAAVKAPIAFVGLGEGPNALMPFRPRSFVRRMLGLVDKEGLKDMQTALRESVNINEEALKQKVQSGTFCLADCRALFDGISGMGDMSSLFGAMGGMGQMMNGLMAQGQSPTDAMKRMTVVFRSMTPKELSTLVKDVERVFCTPSSSGGVNTRILRVARGCGVPPQQVQMMLGLCAKLAGILEATTHLENKKASDRDVGKSLSQLAGLMPQQVMEGMGGMEGLSKMLGDLSSGSGGSAAQMNQLQRVAAQLQAGRGMGGPMPGQRVVFKKR